MSTVRRSEPRLDAGHLLKALAHLSFNLAKILWTLMEKAWISEGLCRPTQLHSQIKNKTMATIARPYVYFSIFLFHREWPWLFIHFIQNIWELQGGLSVLWVNDRSIFANKTVTKYSCMQRTMKFRKYITINFKDAHLHSNSSF